MNRLKGVSAMLWSIADKILTNIITLIISIILARLIAPSEYGVLATASIFTVLLSLFVEPGMTSGLIQKKNSDKLDFSTILSFNIVVALFLYLILFISSGAISKWFDLPILSSVLKILGLQVIIGSVNSVQIAYVHKQMLFKRYFVCSFISVCVSAVVGIFLAYKGAGVWALVAYNLIKQAISAVMIYVLFKCRFGLRFSRERFIQMFPFSGKMLFTKFIDQGYVEATQAIISKVYSPTDLAFYNKGKSFPDLIINSLNSAISSVLFPFFSDMQDDTNEIRKTMRFSVKMTSYICIPMMIGLIACAENFVYVVLTEKWMSSVPFLQLCCFYCIWIPFSNIIRQALKAIGQGSLVLNLEVFKTVLNISSLILFLMVIKSPLAIAISVAFSYTVSFFVEWFVIARYLKYKIRDIIIDFMPSFLMSCLMGLVVYVIGLLNMVAIWRLVIQVISGIVLYVLFTVLLKFPQIGQMLFIMKQKWSSK